MQTSFKYLAAKKLFDETLNTLVQNHSIKSNIDGTRVCLPLPKHLQEQNTGSQPDTITSEINIAPSKFSSLKTTNYITFVDKLHN